MSHTHSPPRKYHISRSISRSPRHTNSTSTAKSSSPSRADSKSIDTVYQFEKFISEEEENEDENLIFRSRPKVIDDRTPSRTSTFRDSTESYSRWSNGVDVSHLDYSHGTSISPLLSTSSVTPTPSKPGSPSRTTLASMSISARPSSTNTSIKSTQVLDLMRKEREKEIESLLKSIANYTNEEFLPHRKTVVHRESVESAGVEEVILSPGITTGGRRRPVPGWEPGYPTDASTLATQQSSEVSAHALHISHPSLASWTDRLLGDTSLVLTMDDLVSTPPASVFRDSSTSPRTTHVADKDYDQRNANFDPASFTSNFVPHTLEFEKRTEKDLTRFDTRLVSLDAKLRKLTTQMKLVRDFMRDSLVQEMNILEPKVIKIQAWWRGCLARRSTKALRGVMSKANAKKERIMVKVMSREMLWGRVEGFGYDGMKVIPLSPEERSAVKLQSRVRGFLTRKQIKAYRKPQTSVLKIQQAWREYKKRKYSKVDEVEERSEMNMDSLNDVSEELIVLRSACKSNENHIMVLKKALEGETTRRLMMEETMRNLVAQVTLLQTTFNSSLPVPLTSKQEPTTAAAAQTVIPVRTGESSEKDSVVTAVPLPNHSHGGPSIAHSIESETSADKAGSEVGVELEAALSEQDSTKRNQPTPLTLEPQSEEPP